MNSLAKSSKYLNPISSRRGQRNVSHDLGDIPTLTIPKKQLRQGIPSRLRGLDTSRTVNGGLPILGNPSRIVTYSKKITEKDCFDQARLQDSGLNTSKRPDKERHQRNLSLRGRSCNDEISQPRKRRLVQVNSISEAGRNQNSKPAVWRHPRKKKLGTWEVYDLLRKGIHKMRTEGVPFIRKVQEEIDARLPSTNPNVEDEAISEDLKGKNLWEVDMYSTDWFRLVDYQVKVSREERAIRKRKKGSPKKEKSRGLSKSPRKEEKSSSPMPKAKLRRRRGRKRTRALESPQSSRFSDKTNVRTEPIIKADIPPRVEICRNVLRISSSSSSEEVVAVSKPVVQPDRVEVTKSVVPQDDLVARVGLKQEITSNPSPIWIPPIKIDCIFSSSSSSEDEYLPEVVKTYACPQCKKKYSAEIIDEHYLQCMERHQERQNTESDEALARRLQEQDDKQHKAAQEQYSRDQMNKKRHTIVGFNEVIVVNLRKVHSRASPRKENGQHQKSDRARTDPKLSDVNLAEYDLTLEGSNKMKAKLVDQWVNQNECKQQ